MGCFHKVCPITSWRTSHRNTATMMVHIRDIGDDDTERDKKDGWVMTFKLVQMLDFQYPQVKAIQAITYMDGIMMKIGADKSEQ